MGNCLGFKIPKDEVVHVLPLAAVDRIVGRALRQSREQGTTKCRIQALIRKGRWQIKGFSRAHVLGSRSLTIRIRDEPRVVLESLGQELSFATSLGSVGCVLFERSSIES